MKAMNLIKSKLGLGAFVMFAALVASSAAFAKPSISLSVSPRHRVVRHHVHVVQQPRVHVIEWPVVVPGYYHDAVVVYPETYTTVRRPYTHETYYYTTRARKRPALNISLNKRPRHRHGHHRRHNRVAFNFSL